MPGRSTLRKLTVLAALLVAIPTQSIAQHHGGRGHGGGWRGGWHGGGSHGYNRGYGGGYVNRYAYGGYPGYYRGYGGYRPYYGGAYYGGPYYGGYVGYPGYYGYGGYYGHHNHHNDAWIAVGAGVLGVVIGSAIAHRQVYPYGYHTQAPPPPAQQCPDGSTIPAGSYCPEPPAPALPPAPEPPLPSPERG